MSNIDPIKLLEKYSYGNQEALNILIIHSRNVAKRSLEIANNVKNLKPDVKFIQEAAMLHDIGIFKTNAPDIKCYGDEPYIRHGILGREILEKEGLLKHALVCERHTGTITKEEIISHNLPLPHRDMLPISLEEKIIAYADKFYTKLDNKKIKSKQEIIQHLSKFGQFNVNLFLDWEKIFEKN